MAKTIKRSPAPEGDFLKLLNDVFEKGGEVTISLLDTMNSVSYLNNEPPYEPLYVLNSGGVLQTIDTKLLKELTELYPQIIEDICEGRIILNVEDPMLSNKLSDYAYKKTAERMPLVDEDEQKKIMNGMMTENEARAQRDAPQAL